jgi:hypothetical protein
MTAPPMQAPEIQSMYSLNLPVSSLRTKMRQEFERHRYVSQTPTVDVLLAKSDMEFQETMNYWKQLSHVLKYFTTDEPDRARLPSNFIHGFMEVCYPTDRYSAWANADEPGRDGIERERSLYMPVHIESDAISEYHFHEKRWFLRRCPLLGLEFVPCGLKLLQDYVTKILQIANSFHQYILCEHAVSKSVSQAMVNCRRFLP